MLIVNNSTVQEMCQSYLLNISIFFCIIKESFWKKNCLWYVICNCLCSRTRLKKSFSHSLKNCFVCHKTLIKSDDSFMVLHFLKTAVHYLKLYYFFKEEVWSEEVFFRLFTLVIWKKSIICILLFQSHIFYNKYVGCDRRKISKYI